MIYYCSMVWKFIQHLKNGPSVWKILCQKSAEARDIKKRSRKVFQASAFLSCLYLNEKFVVVFNWRMRPIQMSTRVLYGVEGACSPVMGNIFYLHVL